MVALNKGKKLRKRTAHGTNERGEKPLMALSSLALATHSAESEAEDLPMSAEELGINLDDIKLKVDEQEGDEEEAIPEDVEAEEGIEEREPDGLADEDLEDGTEAIGLFKELEEVAPRLPFLFTEREGRDIVLFGRSRLLPTIRIKLKGEDGTEPAPMGPAASPSPESVPTKITTTPSSKIVDFTKEQDIESLMGELGLPSGSLRLEGVDPGVESVIYGIPPGAIVLIEGGEDRSMEHVADRLAESFLDIRRSLTYISTKRDLKEVVEGLFESPGDASTAMKDMRLLVIPVYPLLQGSAPNRPELLDKLTSAPQLFDKNVILLNAFTDFLDEGIDDLEVLSIWPFLRKLSAGDKVVVLVASSEHRAIASMRSACSVHLKVFPSGKGVPAVEVCKAPEDRPDRLHPMKFQVNAQGALGIL